LLHLVIYGRSLCMLEQLGMTLCNNIVHMCNCVGNCVVLRRFCGSTICSNRGGLVTKSDPAMLFSRKTRYFLQLETLGTILGFLNLGTNG
jgi:hypothetical protein